ncbi:hypothetical protein Tco_0752682 [Tanacetum coccineum]|uniref:Uncharacterized protein n=1 Tax=Tanacetum coccineum TaxID=301880 RepID=A0ABQ4Z996_9ASTR
MVVQDQAEIGEGSANPTDPHHTPTFIQPSTSKPEKKQKPRKPKIKVTQIPQSSGPTKHVADEDVYKELDDSLVKVTTTASSLEAKQDSGNIAKTQSKATPNESSSLGTTYEELREFTSEYYIPSALHPVVPAASARKNMRIPSGEGRTMELVLEQPEVESTDVLAPTPLRSVPSATVEPPRPDATSVGSSEDTDVAEVDSGLKRRRATGDDGAALKEGASVQSGFEYID